MDELTTTDVLIKAIEGLGNMAHNAGVAMAELFSRLNRFNRRCLYEYNMWRRSWDLYTHPNNKRKIDGKPLVRIRAYKKAWRNERRK